MTALKSQSFLPSAGETKLSGAAERKMIDELQRGGQDELGVALLMTIFVLTLATILVFEIGHMARFDQRSARAFSESVHADFLLKSGVNLARFLLEIPKGKAPKETWLGEPWALISAEQALPIEGVLGEPRIMIVDEDGKIDLNWSVGSPSSSKNPTGTTGQTAQQAGGSDLWKLRLGQLFNRLGFTREQYDRKLYRTAGNVSFEAFQQIAVIDDFCDADSQAFSSPNFPGDGIESSGDKTMFYNRKFLNLSEVLLVPGMTRERLARITPYVKVGGTGAKKVNVNTAPIEVLLALGVPEIEAIEIVQKRQSFPYDMTLLQPILNANTELKDVLTTKSNEFSVYVRISMPNSTRWIHAILGYEDGEGGPGATELKFLETY